MKHNIKNLLKFTSQDKLFWFIAIPNFFIGAMISGLSFWAGILGVMVLSFYSQWITLKIVKDFDENGIVSRDDFEVLIDTPPLPPLTK